MKPMAKGFPASGTFGLLLLAQLLLGGCVPPVMPGCSPDESLPLEEDHFLTVMLEDGDTGGGSVSIDRTGRSFFVPDYTVGLFTTPALCRTLSAEDLQEIRNALSSLENDPGDPWPKKLDSPALALGYTENGVFRGYFVKPRSDQDPARREAARRILAALSHIYGNRFVRELRGAGLLPLLDSPSEKR